MIFFFSHSHKIRTLQGLCPLPPHSHICGWWIFPAFMMLVLRYCSRCCCVQICNNASSMTCCIIFLNFVFIRFIWENALSTAELLNGNASMDRMKFLSSLKSFSPVASLWFAIPTQNCSTSSVIGHSTLLTWFHCWSSTAWSPWNNGKNDSCCSCGFWFPSTTDGQRSESDSNCLTF